MAMTSIMICDVVHARLTHIQTVVYTSTYVGIGIYMLCSYLHTYYSSVYAHLYLCVSLHVCMCVHVYTHMYVGVDQNYGPLLVP